MCADALARLLSDVCARVLLADLLRTCACHNFSGQVKVSKRVKRSEFFTDATAYREHFDELVKRKSPLIKTMELVPRANKAEQVHADALLTLQCAGVGAASGDGGEASEDGGAA